jgi:hypothetical protein
MLDVVLAVAELLEPDSSGVVRDESGAEPFFYVPNTLYAWCSDDRHVPDGAGGPLPCVREEFEITAVFAAADDAEQAGKQRSGALSATLDAKGAAYALAIAQNRSRYSNLSDTPWEHLVATVDHDVTSDRDIRGVGMRISGYRYLYP